MTTGSKRNKLCDICGRELPWNWTGATRLRRILDLDRFPLDRPDSDSGRTLLAHCRRELDASGMFSLTGFIRPEALAVDTVEQPFWALSRDRKRGTLLAFVQQHKPDHTLVFVNRRDQAHRLVSYLQGRGVRCEGLAGDIPQRKRLATMQRFKDGTTNLVIATDVAGRGIHVEGISHVINYDLPEDAEDYVHRIGRTGRAGASGIAISFVSEDDAFDLPAIEALLGHDIACTQPEF